MGWLISHGMTPYGVLKLLFQISFGFLKFFSLIQNEKLIKTELGDLKATIPKVASRKKKI